MLYCEHCGQCIHINEHNFREVLNLYGWETNSIDPVTGESIECIESDTPDSDHERFECPNCDSYSINMHWHGSEETARAVRKVYDERVDKERLEYTKEREKRNQKETLKNSEWDLSENII